MANCSSLAALQAGVADLELALGRSIGLDGRFALAAARLGLSRRLGLGRHVCRRVLAGIRANSHGNQCHLMTSSLQNFSTGTRAARVGRRGGPLRVL